MDLGLAGRHAIVTGASKGIGLATAQTLASEGCRVTLVARSGNELALAADRIGAGATSFPADLSQGKDVDRLWEEVGTPDILVNNAGAIPSGDIATVQDAAWRSAWDLKVFGYINMCRHAMATMTQRRSGVIINIIGSGGEKPTPAYIAGAGGNAALMAITRALGSTSIASGVRLVGINPGPILTARLETMLRVNAAQSLGDAERWHELIDTRYPPGKPEQIAALVAFLASDLSGNTSGTIVTADGGASGR